MNEGTENFNQKVNAKIEGALSKSDKSSCKSVLMLFLIEQLLRTDRYADQVLKAYHEKKKSVKIYFSGCGHQKKLDTEGKNN